MIVVRIAGYLFIVSLLFACNKSAEVNERKEKITEKDTLQDSIVQEQPAVVAKTIPYEKVPDSGFVVMNSYARDFTYDMRYATDDNFLGKAVYACDHCLVRKEVADALQRANDTLLSQGFRIKFYDCYRPIDVQKQMWKIYPNARYVANPYTTGSIHNKGSAVDITLVDLQGKELDMGTSFDHFGKEAHHAYTNLPDTVLSNRRLLKETMEAYGFRSITSEWWHYNFKSTRKYAVSNFSVQCKEDKVEE